ncbi:hypothetical protein PNEG_01316 [Pneumocystis murina B123]|uniref:EKC/KEOPS complex subunit GON7 n=1 Tax=Pneumocystis murina (strain B123) TaxID=1069680 RepID=M7NPH8_PNEMU|nr:hypothetical protein PNEG_01316 [Pneumocystis murina B123]EMR10613.1 hypothetical protein PNEG_01316 [Pneumocystis murina B123]
MSNQQYKVKAIYLSQEKQIKTFEYDLLKPNDEFSKNDFLIELEKNIIKIQEDCNKILTEKINEKYPKTIPENDEDRRNQV